MASDGASSPPAARSDSHSLLTSALQQFVLESPEEVRSAQRHTEIADGNLSLAGSTTAEAQVQPDAMDAIAALTAKV